MGGNLFETAGALIPAIAVELLTGTVAPTGEMAVANAVTRFGKIISKGSKIFKFKPSEVVFMLGAAGSSAERAYETSGSVGKSLAYGSINGLAEGMTEKLFGGFAGTDIGDSLIDFTIKNKYFRKALNILSEGVEEMIMAGVDPFFQRITGVDKNAKVADWKEYLRSAGSGVALSLLMGVGTYPIKKMQKTKAVEMINTTIEKLNPFLLDEKKLTPLTEKSSMQEIEDRQGQIKDLALAYSGELENTIIETTQATDSLLSRVSPNSYNATMGGIGMRIKEQGKVNSLIRLGLSYGENSKSYQLAKSLKEKKGVTNIDIGQLATEVFGEYKKELGIVAEHNKKADKMAVDDKSIPVTNINTQRKFSVVSQKNTYTEKLTGDNANIYNTLVSNLKKTAEEQGLLDKTFYKRLNRVSSFQPSASDVSLINSEFHRIFASTKDASILEWLAGVDKIQSALANVNEQNMSVADANGNSPTNLTVDEEGAILKYKSSESYALNEKMYLQKALTDEENEFVRRLLSALAKLPKYQGKVYRNITFFLKGREAFDNYLKQHTSGGTVNYSSFVSASRIENGYEIDGELSVHMEIESVNGADIESYGVKEEREVLFAPDTEFTVLSVENNGNSAKITLKEVANDEELAGTLAGNQEIGNDTGDKRESEGNARENEFGRGDKKISVQSSAVRGRGTAYDKVFTEQSGGNGSRSIRGSRKDFEGDDTAYRNDGISERQTLRALNERNITAFIVDVFKKHIQGKTVHNYWNVYALNKKFLSSAENIIGADFVRGYIDTFVEMIKSNNSAAFKALSSDSIDITQALYDYVTTGAIPESVTNTKAFMSVAETVKNILTKSISANISAHNSIYGQNATLDAQVEAIKNGDFSFVAEKEYTHLYDEGKVSKEFLNSVNEEIENAIISIRNGDLDSVPDVIEVTELSPETIKKISEFVGFDISGYKCRIEKDALVHIEKRHGINGEHDQSLSDPKDAARMGYTINHIDNIEWATDENGNVVRSRKYNNKDNTSCPVMFLSSRIDGTYCVSQTVPDTKRKTIWVTSARIEKADGGSQVPNGRESTPQPTPKAPLVSSSANNNIPQNEQIVNNNGMQNGENNASKIVTLKQKESIYSVFEGAKLIYEGADCITDKKVVIPKSDEAIEGISAVSDATIEASDRYNLARVYDKSNSVIIKGEPKVADDGYIFKIDGKFYACRQKHLDAFNDGKRIIKANINEKTGWTVYDEDGKLVALFMPLKTSSATEDVYNSLPYVSEVLTQEKTTDETLTKELKSQVENDTIEENDVENINYSLEETDGDDGVMRTIEEELSLDELMSGFKLIYTKLKVFPPYNKSKSDANEQATRWAHKDEIEAGTQKLISYYGRWYVIEKFDSADLRYQIVGVVSAKEINKLINGVKKRENRFKQSKQRVLNRLANSHEGGSSVGLRRHSSDYYANQYGRQTGSIQKLDKDQNEEQSVSNDTGRSVEQDSTDRQAGGRVDNSYSIESEAHYGEQNDVEKINYSLESKGRSRKKNSPRKRTTYNEYQTNALMWARDTDRKVGDITILSANGKYFALIEATEDGFIELRKGSYKGVKAEYERIHSEKDTSFYEDIKEIRTERNANLWDMQHAGDGRNDVGDSGQTGSQRLQTDASRNNEHLRSSNQGKTDADGRGETSRDTIEENDIDRINYSLESGAESIDAGGESQHKSYGGVDFDYSKTTQKIYNNRAWAYTLLSKEDLRLLNEKYYEHFKTNAYRKAKLSDGKTRVIEINNKLLFVSGTYNNPVIEALLAYNVDNSTDMEILKLILFSDVVDNDYSKHSLRRIKSDTQIYDSLNEIKYFDFYEREDYTSTVEKNGWGAKIEDGRKAFGYTGSFTIRDGIYRKDESRVSGTLSNTSGIKYSFVEDNEYDFDGFRNEKALESEAHYGEGRNLLSDGSGKRKDSKSAGKQAKRVDGRSRSYKEGRKTASERRKYCQTLKASGSVERRIVYGHQCEVISEAHYNDRMRKIADQNSQNGIDETIFITGMATLPYVKDSSGKSKKAKGIFIKSKDGRKIVVVQYDHLHWTPEQINDHELVHEDYDSERTQKVKNIIFNTLPQKVKEEILGTIQEDYSGVLTNAEEGALEELVANILTEMHYLSDTFSELTKAYWNKDDVFISRWEYETNKKSFKRQVEKGYIDSIQELNERLNYEESVQLREYIMSVNNSSEGLKTVDCKEIGNNFYVWRNSSKTDYSILFSVPVVGNKDLTEFYRNEMIDNDGAAERIWKMYSIFNAGQGNGISGGVDAENPIADGSNGGIPYGKSKRGKTDADGPGDIGESSGDTSTDTVKYSLADDGEYDFGDIWDEAVETYGAIPEGEKPAREVSVPKKISEDEPVSYFARTMMEAGVTPDEALSEFEQAILDGTMSHEVITDKRALKYAQDTIKREGFDQALEDWSRDSARGKVGKKDLAVGMELYNQCVNNKDYKNAMKIAAELAAEATRAGQALQACRLLKQMSPDGQLYYLEKSVAKMNEEFKEKLGKRFEDIELDEELMEEFFTSESEEQRNAAYDKICQNIADQIPATLQDKWNSWRYLAMLGNPRTHIRNIIGNAVFTPAIRIKNYIGAGLEKTLNVEISERTKSVTKSKEALEFAKNDFNEMVKVLQGVNAKYAVTTDIEERRQIFKTRAFEKLRNKNFEFLEIEDMWFLKAHYVDALARIITARGIDVNSIDSDTLDKVRAYAVKEAQAATYRDANVLAEGLNKLQRKAERSDNKAVRATSVLMEGVMPFKKTPLNIAKQGIQYSPLSILTGIYQLGKGVKEGTHTATEAIDTLSKGITGTGLMILGYFLAQLGMLVGEEEEPEKKRKFDKAIGEQSYSIKIGDSSYTIDWAAPLNLSLFTGTALYDVTKDGEFSFKKVADALSTLPEPLLELSVFSGISDIITSAQYEKTNPMVPIAINMGNNYITQGLPTIGGQISRVSDSTKRNYYYEDKNSGLPSIVQNFIGKVSSKIPFVSRLFEPSVDIWGREETYGGFFERAAENFISPGYYSQEDYNAVNKELQALYERTGETDVLPRTQQKYYTESGVEYYMTVEQYTEAKKLRGQKSFELIEKLIKSSRYTKMDDADKIKEIKKCYDAAGDYAKKHMIEAVKNN